MISDRTVQLVLQALVAISLIALCAWYATQGQNPPEWLVAAILAALGALFGFQAINGWANRKKTRR